MLGHKQFNESTISNISGEIDLSEDQSEANPYIMSFFAKILFITQDRSWYTTKFKVHKE